MMLNLVRPKNFIPAHGELRQLKRHARLAEEVGIPAENIFVVENGQIVELENGKIRLGERIPGGYVVVEGNNIGDADPDVMREREQLARSGILMIKLRIDKRSNHLIEEPEIITRGFIYTKEADELMEATRKVINETIWNSEGDVLQDDLQQALKAFFYNETKRRPMIFVTLSRA